MSRGLKRYRERMICCDTFEMERFLGFYNALIRGEPPPYFEIHTTDDDNDAYELLFEDYGYTFKRRITEDENDDYENMLGFGYLIVDPKHG